MGMIIDNESMVKKTILVTPSLWSDAKSHMVHFNSVGRIIRILLWGYVNDHIDLVDLIKKMDN